MLMPVEVTVLPAGMTTVPSGDGSDPLVGERTVERAATLSPSPIISSLVSRRTAWAAKKKAESFFTFESPCMMGHPGLMAVKSGSAISSRTPGRYKSST